MWDATKLLGQKQLELENIMSETDPVPWFVNIISISQGYNIIFTKSEAVKKVCKNKLRLDFKGDLATTDKLVLRKTLMKELRV